MSEISCNYFSQILYLIYSLFFGAIYPAPLLLVETRYSLI